MRARSFASPVLVVVGCISVETLVTTGQHSTLSRKDVTLARELAMSTRLPWGDPDLQGVYTNIDELNVPLERPVQFEGRATLTDSELKKFARESNETRRRTSEQNFNRNAFSAARNRFDLKPSRAWLVVDPPDGKIPPLTVQAQQRIAARVAEQTRLPDSYKDLNLWHRCISLGLPRSMMPSVDEPPYRIVQAPGFVAITYEMIHEARIIPLDGRAHVGSKIRSYMGDARGHWQGDSLIVETDNFKDPLPVFPPGASDALRIVEQFKSISRSTVEWSVTFYDQSAWARPWTIAMNLTKSDESQHAFEYACHEGNLTLSNLLSSARVDENSKVSVADSAAKR
jgi:hypothetical protein